MIKVSPPPLPPEKNLHYSDKIFRGFALYSPPLFAPIGYNSPHFKSKDTPGYKV